MEDSGLVINMYGGSRNLNGGELSSHVNTLRNGFHHTGKALLNLVKSLIQHPLNKNGIFNVTVDVIALNLPTYFAIVEHPMDLGTIRHRVEDCYYTTVSDFVRDVRLVFYNALRFNPPGHPVYISAKKLLDHFESQQPKVLEELVEAKNDLEQHRCNNCAGNACPLCYAKCLEFEIPVLRCSAPCKVKIKRGATFYRQGGERGQYWCGKCYEGLPDVFSGLFGQQIEKEDLEERVHDEVLLEPWIECQQCRRWMHQICSLYNAPEMQSHLSKSGTNFDFICPLCSAEKAGLNLEECVDVGDNSTDSGDSDESPSGNACDKSCVDERFSSSKDPVEQPSSSGPLLKTSTSVGSETNVLQILKQDTNGALSKDIQECTHTAEQSQETCNANDSRPSEIIVWNSGASDLSCYTNSAQKGSHDKSHSCLKIATSAPIFMRKEHTWPLAWFGAIQSVPRPVVRASPRSHLGRSTFGRFSQGAPRLSKVELATPPEFGGADAIPHCNMSLFIENKVRQRVESYLLNEHNREAAYPKHFHKPKHLNTEDVDVQQAKNIAMSLQVRVVSNMERSTTLDPRMNRWIDAQHASIGQDRHFPKAFNHRSKVILLMQRIDGVDVIVFVMYMQEYGADCPKPNKRKVYISYLDSVSFMQPRAIRSIVYHEVMASYFHWVKARGFELAYIWACPPRKGDAYIIFCHPCWQRTPSAERLRRWYNAVIDTCIHRKIVLRETNLHAYHFPTVRTLMSLRGSRKSQDVHSGNPAVASDTPVDEVQHQKFKLEQLPVFQGDYIPTEIDMILSRLGAEAVSGTKTATSNEEPNLTQFWRSAWGSKSLVTKRCSGLSTVTLPHDFIPCIPKPLPVYELKPQLAVDQIVPENLGFDGCASKSRALATSRDDWLMRNIASAVYPMKDNFMILQLSGDPIQSAMRRKHLKGGEPSHRGKRRKVMSGVAANTQSTSTAGSMEGAAISSGEKPGKGPQVEESKLSSDKDHVGLLAEEVHNEIGLRLEADTSDPDPCLPPSVFDSRLALLDICQMNNLQFDQLRRAKHSSIVLLGLHMQCISMNSKT